MSRIYNAYMSDEERLYAVESAREDLQFARYAVMLDMIDQKLNLNKKAAELKVLEESGTYDDLKYLYTEAENEAKQEKTGVIQSVVNAIKTVLNSIANAIKKFTGNKRDPNELIEVNSAEWDNSNKLISGWNKVTSAMNKPDDENGSKINAVIAAVSAVLGSIGVAEGANIIYKKIKYGDIKNQVTKIDQINQSIIGFMDNSILGPISRGVQSVINIFSGKKKEDTNGDGKVDKKDNQDPNGDKDGTDNKNLGIFTNLTKRIREILQGFKIPIGSNKANNTKAENQPAENTGDKPKEEKPAEKPAATGEGGTGGTGNAGGNDGTTESVEDDVDDTIFGLRPEDYLKESFDEDIAEIMEILGDD